MIKISIEPHVWLIKEELTQNLSRNDYFLVTKQIQKQLPRFLLQNMCSENLNEILVILI